MRVRQRFSGLATVVLVALEVSCGAHVVRGEEWARSEGLGRSDCGCTKAYPAAGPVSIPLAPSATRPFWMRQTPTYKSTSARVPVTNYQTQVVRDPLSGLAVTTYQPCNTYEAQVRRTPGCSFWQRLVNWWNARCGRCSTRATRCETVPCPPTSEWAVVPSTPSDTPYYAPPSSGRLVPVPSGVSPTTPLPADRRPRLDPPPQGSSREGSASRLRHTGSVIFVGSRDARAAANEGGPPLVAPSIGNAVEATAHDSENARLGVPLEFGKRTADGVASGTLIPVSWPTTVRSQMHSLPTDEVWDDTGWQSED